MTFSPVDLHMGDRERIISFIKSVAKSESLTIKEISEGIEVNQNTVAGWVSDESNFPPSKKRGARNQKRYPPDVAKFVALYSYALRHNGNIKIKSSAIIDAIRRHGIEFVEERLLSSDEEFIRILMS